MPAPTVKIALSDRKLAGRLADLLGRRRIHVEQVAEGDTLWKTAHDADVIVVRRGEVDPDLLRRLDHDREAPGVVVVSDHDDPYERAQLVAAGATQVVCDTIDLEALGEIVSAIADADGEVEGPTVGGHDAEPKLADFASTNERMREFLSVVERVVQTDATLLITGETGVGKERLARAIHNESERGNGPFVSVHCGALPEQLLEAELFGHEKGAFTGAERRYRGRFEQADGGTIFLDEIGEMPQHLQVKLLTVLQDRRVRRLGSERDTAVDVRVVAATNKDLSRSVADHEFREDLFYRLNVVRLEIPPLRERAEDIPVLVGRFVKYFRDLLGSRESDAPDGISEAALQAMISHPWPGNTRELSNVIERAMLLGRGKLIRVDDLPAPLGRLEAPHVADLSKAIDERRGFGDVPAECLDISLSEFRQRVHDHFERLYLIGLLDRNEGVVGRTARDAGISPRSLYDKMRRHDLRKEDFRPARS